MAIYANELPYMLAVNKKVILPQNAPNMQKGHGELAFLFTENPFQSIQIINNKNTLYHDPMYRSYFYNLKYSGKIANRRYYIMNQKSRKDLYLKIRKETGLVPDMSMVFGVTDKNTYFDMSKYIEIYRTMTEKFTYKRKINIFWAFFKSIWFSNNTEKYPNKFVIINADNYEKFESDLKVAIDNPLFMLYYTLYKHLELIQDMDIDFYIYCKSTVLRVNPSKCDEKSFIKYKREINRIFSKKTPFSDIDDQKINEEAQKELVKDSLRKKYNLVGDAEKSDLTEKDLEKNKLDNSQNKTKLNKKKDEVEKIIDNKINKAVEKSSSDIKKVISNTTDVDITDTIQVTAELDIDKDKEIVDKMYELMQAEKIPTKPISSARDAELRKNQEEIKVGNLSVKDLNKINASKRLIPEKKLDHSLHTINENVKTMKFANMNKDYIQNVMPSDITNVFMSLNNKSSKFYVKNIEVTDSSNELNYKETWKVSLVDEKKKPHKITVDIPKFLENKFLYLGGNKKIIDKQNFLYPVVKTAPDTVQIVSNYNKMFIRRLGSKSISAVERIMKLIAADDECYKYFKIGNNTSVNKTYLTTIEYDEFGKVLNEFRTSNCRIFFSQKNATDYAEKNNINIPKNYIFIGTKHGENIFIDADSQVTNRGETICDIIVSQLPDDIKKEFSKTRSTKKLMYNTVTIMAQAIPFIVLLLYWEGITSVVKKMNLKYRFSARYPSEVKPNEAVIRFKDGYFVYEEDLAISLLMNGVKVLDTENYNMIDYNETEPYLDYFKKIYGKVAIINALSNAYDFMIDPITEEILEDINLPTDLVELCIYANSLLADESYTMENSQVLSRIRSSEVIPAILYNELSFAYIAYKNSAGKNSLSLPKDCVIKELMKLQTVEDYSVLNPVVELEKERSITSKGFRGINMERAYTEEKRSYDDTMVGIMAMSTSPDGNCGINRFLTMEPTVTCARGYVDIKKDNREELSDVNLFSPTELLYPLGNTRDDSIRTAMAGKQSKHVIPIKNSSPALMANGVDEAIRFELSSDFIVNADQDGEVIDYDDRSKILMLKYKNGTTRAVDLAPHIAKNGGGGFFLNNQLTTKYKVGDKFKKDDCIAYHKDFFMDDDINGVRMNVGVLTKVAISSSYNTYNDSCMITEKLANESAAEMTFCKSVVVGKNSNIYDIRKVGDHVDIGQSLIDFDVSFEDNDLNKLLAHLSEENKEALEEGSMNSIKSKYAGTIVDIKIYSTVELDEMSDSLRKIVKRYYNAVDSKKSFVSKYETNKSNSIVKCGLLLNETSGKIEPNIYGVIKGQKVEDSVLIEFYIEHKDIMSVGDKLAYFTALKSIIGQVIPEGYEPYSEFRPQEEVSSIIGPSAILKRQVPSILLTVSGNKVIVELKRKLKELYDK